MVRTYLVPIVALLAIAVSAWVESPSPRLASAQTAIDGIPTPETRVNASLVRPTGRAPGPLDGPPSFALRSATQMLMPRVANTGPSPIRKQGAPDPEPSTDHFVVVDGSSGAVLYERNGYVPVAPASTTKVMTAILGVEYGRLDDKVQVDVDARSMAGSSLMGLEPWFDVTLKDLLYGLMLVSGNDAALAIARYVSGSDDDFVRLMNDKAAWLGLRSTHFANPHGLDTSDHYSSPYDLAVMARYGMQYSTFREVVSARTYEVASTNLALELFNLNPLLSYPGADGVKTGLTDSAGRALVGTAVENGHRVYVAFMRSDTGAAADGAVLLDWAFNSFDWPDPRWDASR